MEFVTINRSDAQTTTRGIDKQWVARYFERVGRFGAVVIAIKKIVADGACLYARTRTKSVIGGGTEVINDVVEEIISVVVATVFVYNVGICPAFDVKNVVINLITR